MSMITPNLPVNSMDNHVRNNKCCNDPKTTFLRLSALALTVAAAVAAVAAGVLLVLTPVVLPVLAVKVAILVMVALVGTGAIAHTIFKTALLVQEARAKRELIAQQTLDTKLHKAVVEIQHEQELEVKKEAEQEAIVEIVEEEKAAPQLVETAKVNLDTEEIIEAKPMNIEVEVNLAAEKEAVKEEVQVEHEIKENLNTVKLEEPKIAELPKEAVEEQPKVEEKKPFGWWTMIGLPHKPEEKKADEKKVDAT